MRNCTILACIGMYRVNLDPNVTPASASVFSDNVRLQTACQEQQPVMSEDSKTL